MARIVIDDREYRRSHINQPRGYGSWGFEREGDGAEFWHTGTLTDARKALRQHVGRVQAEQVWYVLP